MKLFYNFLSAKQLVLAATGKLAYIMRKLMKLSYDFFRRLLFFKSPDFYDKFPVGSQEYKEGFFILFYFLLGYFHI
jgi:hypothetical protein